MEKIKQIFTHCSLGQPLIIKPLEKNSTRNFFVKTIKGEFVITFYEKDARFRSLSELKAQQELSHYLIKKKFSVAPIVKIIKDKKTNVLIKKYLPGKAKSVPSKKQVTIFAKTFGQFHKLIQNYRPKNKVTHRWDLATTKKHLAEMIKTFPKDKFLKNIKSEFEKIHLPKTLPSGFIHEDLGRRHVLWDKEKITSFIDFERSYFAPLIYDLGQVLRGWCFHSNWQKWCNKKLANILTHYSQYREITLEEKKHLYSSIEFAVLERAFSFYLKNLLYKNEEAKAYALHSLNYLLPLLRKKKEKIESIINAV